MAGSLRDQLIKSGLTSGKKQSKPKKRQKIHKPRPSDNEVDLARAYALRARQEAKERKQAKAQAEAEARAKRERKRKLEKVLANRALNKPNAELVRHFEYGGKIRRIYVDKTQLDQLNHGELGVVQLSGGYKLVTMDVIAEIKTFAPEHIALWLDGNEQNGDDDVPADLMW